MATKVRGRPKRTLLTTKKGKSRKRPTPKAPTSRANSGRYRRGSTTITDEVAQKFLATLMEGWSPTRAAEVAGSPRATFYALRENDDRFRALWDTAVEAGSDKLEDAAKSRSIDGWVEPVFYQGEACGLVRKFSDTLLMFQLNGRRPEKYRQNIKVDGPDLSAAYAASMAKATSGKG